MQRAIRSLLASGLFTASLVLLGLWTANSVHAVFLNQETTRGVLSYAGATPTTTPTATHTATPTSTPTASPIVTLTATRTETATLTATLAPALQKLPAVQNLFLTRQGGDKIPPVTCAAGNDVATFTEELYGAIDTLDPKGSGEVQQLGAFEFEVHFDETKVCVDLAAGEGWTPSEAPGAAAAGDIICIIEDDNSNNGAPAMEGVARIGCVTVGKEVDVDDTLSLAIITVRPQPDVYSQAKPDQENGVVVQLNDVGCELADEQGHPIPIFSCEDADVTLRYLEGDVQADCSITSLDTQGIAFRWGAGKGSLLYLDRFNLEPSGAQADNDIDIKDLQFVYGRFGSTCADPHPPQPPVNPKE